MYIASGPARSPHDLDWWVSAAYRYSASLSQIRSHGSLLCPASEKGRVDGLDVM